MGNPREPLTFENTFHIYNHAVGDERLFRETGNYHAFMSKYMKWIVPVSETLAYNLIPNHYHLLVRIKPYETCRELFGKVLKIRMGRPTTKISEYDMVQKIMNEQFSHCFNSYAQWYNKRYSRWGSLFKESFQRKAVVDEDYLRTLICYIHHNPVHHGLSEFAVNWKFSSYNDLFHNEHTIVSKDILMEVFETIDNLVFVHDQYRHSAMSADEKWLP